MISLIMSLPSHLSGTFSGGRLESPAEPVDISVGLLDFLESFSPTQLHEGAQLRQGAAKATCMVHFLPLVFGIEIHRAVGHVSHVGREAQPSWVHRAEVWGMKSRLELG